MATPLQETARGCLIHLHAAPRASRTRLAGLHGERLKIQVAAPPVDGQANEAIVAFLAKALDVPRSDIEWVSGETGRQKTLEVLGLGPAEVGQRLGLE